LLLSSHSSQTPRLIRPLAAVPCSITLGAVEKKFWAAFCGAIGQESFIEEQFMPERQAHLIHEVSEILARKTSSDWIEFFQSVDTCVSPVNNVSEVLQGPGIRACRGLIMPDDPAGAPPRLGVIPKLS